MDELKQQIAEKDMEIQALRDELAHQMESRIQLRKLIIQLATPPPVVEEDPASNEE